jgi:hypothetical protein
MAVPGARPQATSAALVTGIAGLGVALTVPTKLSIEVAAGFVAVFALASVGMLPGLAVSMAGTLDIEPSESGAKARLARAIDDGRDMLAWMLVGASVLLTGAAVLFAAGSNAYGLALSGVIAGSLALQARHHGFRAEALPLALAALVCAGALEIGLTIHFAPAGLVQAVAAGVALVDALVVVGIVAVAADFKSSVDSRHWFGVLEFLFNAAVIPLVVGLVGVYDFVFGQAKHLL